MIKIIQSLLTEYGLKWTINRSLYSAKLKIMSRVPATEKLYEKRVNVKRIDIFEFDISEITKFLSNLSNEKKVDIISIADKAIKGIITGFSSIELNYGIPIKWHFNPLTGSESKKDIKWYRIPDFDGELGDIKAIWEASRFTHFYYLIRAYLLTGDNKYYSAFSNQLEDWLESNTYPFGVNYKCGQESSLRMVNVLMAYSIFNQCGLITKRDKVNVMRLVEVSYKKVLSNFFYAHKCIKNNHTFSEICGLIVGAWCCEDKIGVKNAYELLDKEIINQFLPDGGFTQYSFNYHRFTLQIIECIYKLGEKTKQFITEKERIKNSVLLLFQVQNIDGDVPNYGSNDGALIFPVSSCSYRDFRPVLNTMYALIEGKRLYDEGDYDEELLWFGSKEIVLKEDIKRKSSIFNESGYYTFRHKTGFLMTCLQNYNSRPAHLDQLHIDLWHKGINVLCDCGTYSYASKLGKKLSSTVGHNTVKVSGSEQMNKKGVFLVTDWSKCEDVIGTDTSFRGTMISKNGYKHKRHIQKYNKGYLIYDEVIADGEFCQFYFNTPCDVKINESGFGLYNEGLLICNIKTNGLVEIEKTYRSLYYLKKEEINCVKVRSNIINKKCSMNFDIHLIG